MNSKIELLPLMSALYRDCDVQADLLRLDQIHPQISGNKWFKLQPFLQAAQNSALPLLSFGGAYSNHIHALAWAGQHLSIPVFGVIRSESDADSPTLQDARDWGMCLHFVSRQIYRQRAEPVFIHSLQQLFGEFILVPEGGSSAEAVHSCSQIWQLPVLEGRHYDYVFCALGTGGTLAGLIAKKPDGCQIIGVPALRITAEEGQQMVCSLLAQADLPDPGQWQVLNGYQRYGKLSAETARLLLEVKQRLDIELDPVYTAVTLGAMNRAILSGLIPAGSRILMIHTGGLQGVRGATERLQKLGPAFNGPLAL
ncbi:1-aminocyclopropane-1-carboxylate deaminase/D-cysteine desulfhydrase [Nitrincola alkalilacustris]|uniref:1-aminocyclopropane-1-carboxylate deaminase/D-cysteine desulfhydrase n=1 Tax=Nitrincola alkalilacustris TaxID=1571224 RepID=UPI00124E4138|nr:pyridoxal-phosphate dependent enzyme [Nitrincola alkalilacustris]